ncbi:malate synthase [Bacillus sp. SG-1]|nr:malate synthase [Bacillus sp. SG-1]
MDRYVSCGNLKVENLFYDFINSEVLPGLGVQDFWDKFERLIEELTPENKALLKQRDDIQNRLNECGIENMSHLIQRNINPF